MGGVRAERANGNQGGPPSFDRRSTLQITLTLPLPEGEVKMRETKAGQGEFKLHDPACETAPGAPLFDSRRRSAFQKPSAEPFCRTMWKRQYESVLRHGLAR